jgi:hypothetical protein
MSEKKVGALSTAKETAELAVAVAATVDAGYKIAEDGKVTLADIAHLIPLVGPWEKAIKDLRLMEELRGASNADVAAIRGQVFAQMGSVPAEDRQDLTAILDGALGAVRMVARKAYRQGVEDAMMAMAKKGPAVS